MSLLKRIILFIFTFHALIGTLFVINVSAIYNDAHIDKQQCLSLFNSYHLELCYNLLRQNLDYCPITVMEDNDE